MAIVKESGEEGHLYNLRETDPEDIERADFYVFGSPTQMIVGPTRRVKKAIKNTVFPNKESRYGLITTSKKEDSNTARKMERMLDERGVEKGVADLELHLEGKERTLQTDHPERIKAFYASIRDLYH